MSERAGGDTEAGEVELAPPAPSERDHLERAQVLRALLAAGLGLVVLASVLQSAFVGPSVPVALNLTAFAAAVVTSLLLLRRDRVDAAAWVFCSVMAGNLVLVSAVEGGAHAPTMPALLLLIAGASLLLHGRASLVFGLVAVVASVGLELARVAGLLPAPTIADSATAHAIAMVVYAPMLGVILTFTLRRLRATLKAAQDTAASLQASIDQTERQRALLLKRARQQATVARLAQLALSGQKLAELLRAAVDDTRELLDADAAVVLEQAADQGSFVARAGAGAVWGPRSVGEAVPGGSSSLSGFTLLQGRAVLANDLPSEARFQPAAPLRAAGFRSAVGAPIHGSERPWGVLVVFAQRAGAFTDDDAHFTELLANLLGVAIEREVSASALLESEAQLRQATKMEAVGRLAGGVAHDFNNLMTAVLAYADLLLPAMASAETRDDVRSIRDAAERAASLTRQLLAFSRRQVLQPRLLDPNAVVESMEKMLRRVIGEDIELSVALGPDVGWALVDPVQLEQVLLNLVVNARDAMPQGGHLALASRRVELGRELPAGKLAAGPWVLLTVRDDGVGIPPELVERIFEPFFTTKPQGTGLGLATVWGIVAQSGGEVRVVSAPGKGTAFQVLLPRHDKPATVIPLHGAAPGAPRMATRRLLVVEDDQQVRRVVTRVLRNAGYEVTEAPSALDALDLLGGPAGFDLVLSDVVMPKMSGAELSRHLRERFPRVKCVLMSGYAADALEQHGPLAPDVELVPKPFSSQELLRAVSKCLR